MSGGFNPRRPPCLICGHPTIPSVILGAISQLCEDCKNRKPDFPTTDWGRGRQAEREAVRRAEGTK